jgi:hypothetical protein
MPEVIECIRCEDDAKFRCIECRGPVCVECVSYPHYCEPGKYDED